jgi:hypothetical protein
VGDPALAFSVVYRASAATLALGFFELFTVSGRTFGPRGPFSPGIARVFGRWAHDSQWLSAGLRLVIAVGAIAGVIGLISGPYVPVGRAAGVLALACLAIVKLRRVTASDGAEQMALLSLFATVVAVVPGVDEGTITLAVWFVAGQSILSYLTAGVAKAISPVWRGGQAITMIMGSESHGQPWAAQLLDSYPTMARFVTRSVVIFECAFPLILLAPREAAMLMLAAGFAMHLGCAVTMGLNAFLLAFPGTYLCVIYAAQRMSPSW